MKKALYFLLFIMATSCIIGCSNDDDKNDDKIRPITVDEDTQKFFAKAFPLGLHSPYFFIDEMEDRYHLINSVDEFRAITSYTQLPELDLEKYTLVIGQIAVRNSFYAISNQYITQSEKIELHLNTSLEGSYYPPFGLLYYWGVYPKLSKNKGLTVDIKY